MVPSTYLIFIQCIDVLLSRIIKLEMEESLKLQRLTMVSSIYPFACVLRFLLGLKGRPFLRMNQVFSKAVSLSLDLSNIEEISACFQSVPELSESDVFAGYQRSSRNLQQTLLHDFNELCATRGVDKFLCTNVVDGSQMRPIDTELMNAVADIRAEETQELQKGIASLESAIDALTRRKQLTETSIQEDITHIQALQNTIASVDA